VLLNVAVVWLTAKRTTDAERVFHRILQLAPEDASAEVGLGLTAIARLDFLAAEAALRRALRHDPGRAAAYLQPGYVHARTDRRPEAARLAETAKRLGAAPSMTSAAAERRPLMG
jgi:tetratricopeptide (TPR) repeat protein